MRTDRHTVARWIISAAFALAALWSLGASVAAAIRARADGWPTIMFLSAFGLLVCGPFALSAFFCFKRRYRDLFMVGAVVGALILISLCFTLPRKLGMIDAIRGWKNQEPWQPVITLPGSLLLLVGPYILAGWLLRTCSRFAGRRLSNGPTASDA